MISKELLSEVLHGSRIIIKDLRNMENCLEYVSYCSINEMNGTKYNENLPDNYYVVKADRWQEINIYELAHKCKEWAWQQHELMLLQTQYFPKIFYGIKDLKTSMEDFITKVPQCDRFSADTEPEAIFKACDYILNELSNK